MNKVKKVSLYGLAGFIFGFFSITAENDSPPLWLSLSAVIMLPISLFFVGFAKEIKFSEKNSALNHLVRFPFEKPTEFYLISGFSGLSFGIGSFVNNLVLYGGMKFLFESAFFALGGASCLLGCYLGSRRRGNSEGAKCRI